MVYLFHSFLFAMVLIGESLFCFVLFSALFFSLKWDCDERFSVQQPLSYYCFLIKLFHWLTLYYYLQFGVYTSQSRLNNSVYILHVNIKSE